MADDDADGWEKVREMVRNSPPPGPAQPASRAVSQTASMGPTVQPVEPRRSSPNKALWIILIFGLVIAGAWFLTSDHSPVPLAVDAGKGTASQTDGAPLIASSPAPEAAAAREAAPSRTMVRIRSGLKAVNVRAGPSTEEASVAKVNGGDEVEKIAESGSWIQIRLNVDGKPVDGWIRNDLLGK